MQISKKIYLAIITPVFNRQEELAIMIESVLSQTYQHWCLYIVDNNSNDDSLKVAKKYSKSDQRIRVAQCSTQGVNHARNLGIEIASGDYAVLLDSDNRFIDNHVLSAVVEMLEKSSDQRPIGIFTPSAIDGVQQELPKGCSGFITFDSYFRYISQELLPIVSLEWLKTVKFPNWRGGYESYVWYRLAMTGKMYLWNKNLQIYSTKSYNRICAGPRNYDRCFDLMCFYRELLRSYKTEMRKASRLGFLKVQIKYAVYKRLSTDDFTIKERDPNLDVWIQMIAKIFSRKSILRLMRFMG
jgi:glycosyltransferase involved in cell wall biosynthesis